MGGTGAGRRRTPGGSNSRGSDPCDLRFQTDLFGPVGSVVQRLSIGDHLAIQLITQGQSQSVAALTQSTGVVVGTIVGGGQLGVLINCLAQHTYEAEVTAIAGSKVTVIVKRVRL